MYQITLPLKPNNESTSVIRLSDNAFIPMDTANTDYQSFLAWKAEGNEPLPAEQE